MKIDLKKTVIATALVSLLPVAQLAMAAKHNAPSQEAIDACKEVNGQLVAVVNPKHPATPATTK